jgi:hypothetical protein
LFSSSFLGSHKSCSGPWPRQRTRYFIPPRPRVFFSSMILSTKCSSTSLTMTGSGACKALDGNKFLLFSMKDRTSEVWKTGKMLCEGGRSRDDTGKDIHIFLKFFRKTDEKPRSFVILLSSHQLSQCGLSIHQQ